MRIFTENQRFRQWWLIILLITIIIASALPLFSEISINKVRLKSLIAPIISLVIFILIFILNLETRINSKGISAGFEPLPFFRRNYNWDEIQECYVRTYAPVSEYGGWGIRGFGRAKAYNVSGNKGIHIITKNNERFLIGTEKPDLARRAINKNFKNHKE
ncbi:hypothetical protein [Christiangramia sp. OXR-203]|uniref:hypothetical protein n=1 Tax=Christiangramia sp. OXR-203 TaxID=3100176 RepID=UPI002AC8FEC0|nr:hypothetical protein [Christiangramia sp. OXR-203]WPY99422.1 hypothetical protein T8I65_04275 [Christiangramia sp. OXR-203]